MSSEELLATGDEFQAPRISFVGVGGAGNNLLSNVIGGIIDPSHCVAVNTDRNQLSRSPALNKVLLDGDSVEVSSTLFRDLSAKRILQVSTHRVRPFTESSDLTIVVAGLGGGTATSTAPLIAQSARSPVRPVLSVVAIPFIHERERRFVALRGLKHMVEACDCTVVIDNAATGGQDLGEGRQADEKVSLAVRGLTELLSEARPSVFRQVLKILSLGQIAVLASAKVRLNGTVQGAVIDALHNPSAGLPLNKTQGAILIHHGPKRLGDAEADRAYETLVSLSGKRVDFLHASVETHSDPQVSLILTGYDYGTAVKGFVDFIEDLYDVEYGQDWPNSGSAIHVPLFQMEPNDP